MNCRFIVLLSIMFSGGVSAKNLNINYDLNLSVVNIGLVQVTFSGNKTKDSDDYKYYLAGRAVGVLSLTKISFTNVITGNYHNDFTPKFGEYVFKKKKHKRTLTINYDEDKFPTVSQIPTYHADKPSEELTADDLKGSIDAFTVVAKIGDDIYNTKSCNANYKVTDGRSVYQIQIIDKGDESIKVKAYKGKARKCLIKTKAIAGSIISSLEGNTIPDGVAYFANVANTIRMVPIKLIGSYSAWSVTLTAEKIW